MKKKYLSVLPCLVILIISSVFNSISMRSHYDEIVDTTGLVNENFEKEIKKENENARNAKDEYQGLLKSEEYDGLPDAEDGIIEEAPDSSVQLPKKLNLRALSALLLDADNNRVLYEVNGYKKLPMASTTKIMTCIVALENADLNGIVPVSSYAAGMPDVQLNINKGDQFYLKDLLFSLMLESHNDVAVAIAEYVGGSVEGFATMMNDKARTLGCYDTNFVTPNGLDAVGHYTTAKDLATIASYAVKNDKFIEITNTSSHSFQEIKKGKKYNVTNKDRFLYMMEGAIGVKTGFTNDAGYCFVGAVRKPDRTLISVVLGCGWPPNKNLKWSDTKELMNYGVKNYEKKQIFEDKEFDPVFVQDGKKKYELLSVNGDLSLLMRKDEIVKIVYRVPKKLLAPVKANVIVGSAKYYIGDVLYAELPIYTSLDIAKIDYAFCLEEIFKMWCTRH